MEILRGNSYRYSSRTFVESEYPEYIDMIGMHMVEIANDTRERPLNDFAVKRLFGIDMKNDKEREYGMYSSQIWPALNKRQDVFFLDLKRL